MYNPPIVAKKSIMILLKIFFLLTTASATGQVDLKRPFVTLLPGYQYHAAQGIDSRTGVIWKERGVRLSFDIGDMAGVYTDCDWCGWTKGETWRKEQTIGDQKVIYVFTKSKRLVVSFPEVHANFYATIRTESDMADVLLMLSTFRLTATP
jgi:hypothetical protein